MVLEKTDSMQSNLGSFLDSTTPVPSSQFLSKTGIKKLNKLWHPWEREKVNFFTLSDLWNCYDEWSAYGAGVPIRLDNGDNLVQYYVPFLSAIQIFVSTQSLNSMREDADSTSETRDTFSDSFSDESESEKLSRWDGCSSEEWVFEKENRWHQNDRLGHLYCQYFDKSPPFGRVPLMDKISALSQNHPGLMSLRSVDLSPASWMAVAWYPIYHIPMGRTIKDLSTCFLTYHTLSSCFQDLDVDEMVNTNSKWKKSEGIALPPFGLATYKMQGDVWVSNKNGGDRERLDAMLSVADSWLKQLRVQHNDYNHFRGIRRGLCQLQTPGTHSKTKPNPA